MTNLEIIQNEIAACEIRQAELATEQEQIQAVISDLQTRIRRSIQKKKDFQEMMNKFDHRSIQARVQAQSEMFERAAHRTAGVSAEQVSEREAALAAARESSKFLLARIEKETLAAIEAEKALPDRPKSEQARIAELDSVKPAARKKALTTAITSKLDEAKRRREAPLHREGFRLLK